ncbi:glycosyl hydrolase family 71 protein [Elsinoe australis]|uniref:Glycosyl hydrolase family 71 protein n=1 Tax=Elsinoe australis TaxID=40998 RepID=A0A4U7B1P6_9PEZI|nr:glycosyl hydrolase family 71 protein [Elsinoe australis]
MFSQYLFILLSCAGYAYSKTALAHFMVQSSYAYNLQQWKTDMASAKQMNLDGFALNWTPPDCQQPYLRWMATQIDTAFQAAEQSGFLLTHSFDMSYSECDYFWNTTYMSDILNRHAKSSANLRWNNKIVVTTFGGDSVQSYNDGFFQDLKDKMNYFGNPISLTPGFNSFSERAQSDNGLAEAQSLISNYTSLDGFLNWQAWPLQKRQNLTCQVDEAFHSALKTSKKAGPYIMAISPWQFKNIPSSTSWLSYSDTLFPDRLLNLASSAFAPDMVELISWNDYGESHYLRNLPSPSISATDYITYASGMQNYILNMSHAPWRILAKYYLGWWKTGAMPKATMDQVVFWYRVHPRAATCTGQLGQDIGGSAFPDDAVFLWALVKETSIVSVDVGANKGWTFVAEGGKATFSRVPFPGDLAGGVVPEVRILRGDKTVAEGAGRLNITAGCDWYNFNPVVNLVGEGVNRE